MGVGEWGSVHFPLLHYSITPLLRYSITPSRCVHYWVVEYDAQ